MACLLKIIPRCAPGGRSSPAPWPETHQYLQETRRRYAAAHRKVAASRRFSQGRLHSRFRAGIELAIPIKAVDEIAKAPIAMLRDVKASPIGDGLIFSTFGEAIYVPGLLRDLFGDAFAGALGKIGGRARSSAKTAAARKNGRKGGRPRKVAA